jgi:riboflavin synthase
LVDDGNRFTKRVEVEAVGAMRPRVFTGLVTSVGVLSNRHPTAQGHRLEVGLTECPVLELGESIAVNGVCLTVCRLHSGGFEADVSAETAERTTLSRLTIGSRLNLERALRLGDRLGGHWVTGHIDGRTRLLGRSTLGESERMSFSLTPSLAPYVAAKGSVALDGVSLTVNELDPGAFAVMLVPHTQRHTTLLNLRPGSEANLEIDVLARYVVHALSQGTATAGAEEGGQGLLAALARAQILTP